jgi:MerR family glutamine synthetase transcriptional repressor
MREKELRRNLSVLPIGTVMKLTELSARQIRYYEEQDLIHPQRSDGNRRLYSLNDIDTLLEIRDYLSEGLNMAKIKKIFEEGKPVSETHENKPLSNEEIRRILQSEIARQGGLAMSNPRHLGKPNL